MDLEALSNHLCLCMIQKYSPYFHTGGTMCLRDHSDGRLLVLRGAATVCDGAAPSPPFPLVWHHGIQRCELNS